MARLWVDPVRLTALADMLDQQVGELDRARQQAGGSAVALRLGSFLVAEELARQVRQRSIDLNDKIALARQALDNLSKIARLAASTYQANEETSAATMKQVESLIDGLAQTDWTVPGL